MPPQVAHRVGALKQSNKPHKTGRHRSKRSLVSIKNGKVEKVTISKKQHTLNKKERKNQASQVRKNTQESVSNKKAKLGGLKGAPFLVAVIPLNLNIDSKYIVTTLCSCDEENITTYSKSGVVHISSKRYKQRFSFICPPVGNGLEFGVLDTLKVSDTVIFLTSANDSPAIDDWGFTILAASKAQGIPTSMVCCMNINSLKPKDKNDVRHNINTTLNSYLPNEKVLDCGSTSDNLNILRRICTQKQKSLLYRDCRPHIQAEGLEYLSNDTENTGVLKITGYLRGTQLNVNDLIHIPGLGDYRMKLVESAADPHFFEKFVDSTESRTPNNTILCVSNPALQQSLEIENKPDPMDAEQTWPTEEEMQEAEAALKAKRLVKTVPKGMSEYQAAWIPDIDEVSVSDEEEESDEHDMSVDDNNSQVDDFDPSDCESEEEIVINQDKYDTNFNAKEEQDDLMKLRAAKEDQQFPDELDTPVDIPARERFRRYRALESFRSSPWDPKENLPADYARIFKFQNYERMRKKILRLRENEVSPVQPGMYITIHVDAVPEYLARHIVDYKIPIIAIGILPHEHKISVMNAKLKQMHDFNEPIKSKERFLIQCGYRRFFVNPIFSEHTNSTRHKFQRFFQPHDTTVATFFAPIQYSPAPVLCYKVMTDLSLKLVATGSLISCDPDRIILKRIVLSGHPFKVNKRSAVIRFMFFNREDIMYFKPCKLRTRTGKSGHIREPLGTHGHMKCVFDHQMQSQDTVFLNLYKRVFPKWNFEHCTLNHMSAGVEQMQDE